VLPRVAYREGGVELRDRLLRAWPRMNHIA
jgi:hypothetical protein